MGLSLRATAATQPRTRGINRCEQGGGFVVGDFVGVVVELDTRQGDG